MKYFNQVNFALAVIAAAAVVYAFSLTYFDPAEPPRIVIERPTENDGATAPSDLAPERGEAPANPRLTQPRPGTALPGVRPPTPRSRTRGAQPEGARPSENRPGAAPLRPEAQADRPPPQQREASGEPPGPDRRPATGGLRPAPRQQEPDEDESEQASPRSFPQTPEGARREQNRRGNPSPPPPRSSMPEQRPR